MSFGTVAVIAIKHAIHRQPAQLTQTGRFDFFVQFGDGIMSAIDFFVTVDKVKGAAGEQRVVITFNGKYLPYAVQYADKAAHKDPCE
jgi:hypothetical protein